MSEKTPARAACEAFWEAAGAGPAGDSPEAAWAWAEREGTPAAWEAAAKAARTDLSAHMNALAEDLDDAGATIADYRDALCAMQHERDKLRDQLAEAVNPTAEDYDNAAEILQLREQLAVIRERLYNLAAGMDLSARTSAPSKKPEIESGCAQAVRGIADSIRGDRPDAAAAAQDGQP